MQSLYAGIDDGQKLPLIRILQGNRNQSRTANGLMTQSIFGKEPDMQPFEHQTQRKSQSIRMDPKTDLCR